MKRSGIIFLTILFFGSISLLPSYSQVLYDDFSGPYIRGDRWRQTELVREVDQASQKLLLKQASPSPAMIPGYPCDTTNGLYFRNFLPVAVDSIQADVAITAFNITNRGYAKGRLGSTWYNDGTLGVLNGGDIWAEVAIQGDAAGLKATWAVVRFLDFFGTNLELGSGHFTSKPIIGTSYTLFIRYDRVSNQFLFKIGDEEVRFGPIGLPPSQFVPEAVYHEIVSTEVQIENATSSGYISAIFDNVYIDGSLYDDFSSAAIDLTKWTVFESGEYVREISDGHLRSKIRINSAESFSDAYSSLDFLNPPAIQTIDSTFTLRTYQNEYGADVAAYITGHFYNDGSSKIWYAGDVRAQIQIGGEGQTPVAEWLVWKYLSVRGDFLEGLGRGTFNMPILLGKPYRLFLGWNGKRFDFRIEDVTTGNYEEASYTPSSEAIEPPNITWKEIGSGIWNRNIGEAAVEVLFDDVMVIAVDNLPPPPPAIVLASGGTYAYKVRVTWSPSPGATSYQVYRQGMKGPILLGSTRGTTFDDHSTALEQVYIYWVKALNSFGMSNFSDDASGWRVNPPSPPTDLQASDGDYTDRVVVTWTRRSDATSYTVYRSASRWGVRTILGSTSKTIYNDTTAIPGKKYYYWVKASNSVGTSRFSSPDTGYRP